MYLPLMGYLFKYTRQNSIPVKYFLLCAIVDVHATLFIVFAYEFTSITSVMLLEDFTIPSAVLLSVFFLKVRYNKLHFCAILICACGMTVSICNDIFIKKIGSDSQAKNHLIGDLMALTGAFLYALSNILQEHYLRTQKDVYDYLGFLGLFGTILTLIEAWIFDDY